LIIKTSALKQTLIVNSQLDSGGAKQQTPNAELPTPNLEGRKRQAGIKQTLNVQHPATTMTRDE
jgi:hypothetical protein